MGHVNFYWHTQISCNIATHDASSINKYCKTRPALSRYTAVVDAGVDIHTYLGYYINTCVILLSKNILISKARAAVHTTKSSSNHDFSYHTSLNLSDHTHPVRASFWTYQTNKLSHIAYNVHPVLWNIIIHWTYKQVHDGRLDSSLVKISNLLLLTLSICRGLDIYFSLSSPDIFIQTTLTGQGMKFKRSHNNLLIFLAILLFFHELT